jgi:tungstate transport system permease protein
MNGAGGQAAAALSALFGLSGLSGIDWRELASVTLLSLRVSSTALLGAVLVGAPLGAWLGTARFRGRGAALSTLNAGMGLPPVLVGLVVSLLLWRSGPLGWLGLMYTPAAMIVAQWVIVLPIIVALTAAAVQQVGTRLRLQLLALGASRPQLLWLLLREARLPILAAVMAGAGRILGEVGAVLMVGGNLRGQTRVLTTATVLETRMGHFEMALALGGVLLLLTLLVNAVLTSVQQRMGSR